MASRAAFPADSGKSQLDSRKEPSMQHPWIASYWSSSGVARWLQPCAFALGITGGSMFAQGCGQSIETAESPSSSDPGAEAALRTVESCQAQARDCFAQS